MNQNNPTDDFENCDDEVFLKYKQERMKELLGGVEEIFIEEDLINKSQHETMIVHFYKDDFKACEIMNRELSKVCKELENIKFYKVKAEIAPVVTNKLQITVLPFLGFFKEGFFVDQVVGFEGMGDERFSYEKMKKRIQESNIYRPVSYIK
ncbi:Phosducin-like protein 3 [Nosema bombycis CQ1]|uniref:Phosducin-like protein 3 n=1 Tax=Nosema bombycis (strain CQ1 / CVCC 102059) TaxID=578461 RepID=R0M1E0_NOSB1|nr:Phosducin-like protein 3 [Nosema bombycis CQ1]|eukprot:EOB11834.1 Phosducin-like protein 3 [Nosema bombycis CQ1]